MVEDKKNEAKVFLDFGMSFTDRGKYFEEYLRPRSSSGLKDFLTLHLLPELENLYRNDLLEFSGMKKHKDVSVDAVLLSHAHQDHHSYISFLDERIPIYCSEITLAYLKALQESGPAQAEQEVVYFRNKLGKRGEKPISRDFRTVKGKFKINGLEVEVCPVDHSVFGDTAFILYCSDATIVYSADLRLHGSYGHLTQEFAEKAALEKPDIYLSEGTRIAEQDTHNEAYVKANAAKTIQQTKGLAIADFAFRDLTRYSTFLEVAKQNERQLLVPFRDAYLIREVAKLVPNVPSIDDKDILLYKEKKRSGQYDEKDYMLWEREFLSMKNTVDSSYVHLHQKDLVASMGYFDMSEFIDIRPMQGSSYIHSLSEPYNEEMVFDDKRLQNWLDFLKLPRNHFHCSGHAPGQDLRQVAKTIDAKTVIPIHTEHPELFKDFAKNVIYPEYGKEIEL